MNNKTMFVPQFAWELLPLTTASIDGDRNCILFGQNIQSGIAGFGHTKEIAERDFCENFTNGFFEWKTWAGELYYIYNDDDMLAFASVCLEQTK